MEIKKFKSSSAKKIINIYKATTKYINFFETVNDVQTLFNLYILYDIDNEYCISCYTKEKIPDLLIPKYEHWNDYKINDFIDNFRGKLPDWIYKYKKNVIKSC